MADSNPQKPSLKGGGKPKEPFLAFVTDSKDLTTLKEFAHAHMWPETCVLQGDVKAAVEYLRTHSSPAILLVDMPNAGEASAQLDALADVCHPETKVVVAGTVNEYSFYCWLMEIGIFDYMLRPITAAALDGMLQRASEPAPTAQSGKAPATVIAVMGTRGGVGATTVAINLATLVAETRGLRTAVVDLDPKHGTLSLDLDLEPGRGLRDALEKPDRIDGLFLDRIMITHSDKLSVLSAEEPMAERVAPHDHAADALMKELRSKFECVVLDVPREHGVFARGALKQADHVLLVTRLTLSGVRDGLRTHDMFRETLKMKPPMVIANAVGQSGKHEVTVGDYDKGVGCKVFARIPYLPDVFMAPEPQPAVVRAKHSPAAKAFQQILDAVLPSEGAEEKEEKTKKKSLFARGK